MTDTDLDNYPFRQASFDRAPSQRHSPTSNEAARLIAPRCGPMEIEILNMIEACQMAGGCGLTDLELIEAMGTQSARPRRIFLVKIGKMRDSGSTRKTRSGRRAVVWVLA